MSLHVFIAGIAIQNSPSLMLANHGLLGFVSPQLWHLWFITHNILAEKEVVNMHVYSGLIRLLTVIPQLAATLCL